MLGSELFPTTSVTVAVAGSDVPLLVAKLVRPLCVPPSWSVMFWMGQVSKKSNGPPPSVGCRKEVLETPSAAAKIWVSPGALAVTVA
jgi:hypothetical protein